MYCVWEAYVRRSTPVETHSRRRLYVLWVGSVCEEIDTGWDAESKENGGKMAEM